MPHTINDLLGVLRVIAPEECAYTAEYDNVGLLVGSASGPLTRALVCLDVTRPVIDQAIELGAQLIVSHHPVIYHRTELTDQTPLGANIMTMLRHGISAYCAHTNLDFVADGINDLCARMLELQNLQPLQPYISPQAGFGRVGTLAQPLTAAQLAGRASQQFDDPSVRIITRQPQRQLSRIAVINGGGGGDTRWIDWAICAGAECLVTADVRHHVAIYALERDLCLVEPSHYCMEYPIVPVLVGRLAGALPGVTITAATAEQNPRQPI